VKAVDQTAQPQRGGTLIPDATRFTRGTNGAPAVPFKRTTTSCLYLKPGKIESSKAKVGG